MELIRYTCSRSCGKKISEFYLLKDNIYKSNIQKIKVNGIINYNECVIGKFHLGVLDEDLPSYKS